MSFQLGAFENALTFLKYASDWCSGKLVSAVADGLHDAVCPLKSYQLLHESQLPQSERVMLRVTINGQTRRPRNCARRVYGRSTRRPFNPYSHFREHRLVTDRQA